MEHWSDYNYCIDFSQDSFLLYNSFSNAFIELPITVKANIERFKSDRNSSVFDKKTRLILQKTGAIYEGIKDKQLNALKICYGNLVFGQPKHIFITVLPTLRCNFRCSCCFENLQSHAMSLEVQEALVNKITQFHQKGYKISLVWSGGEPLIEIDIIDSILSRLNTIGMKYTSIIKTNGYLLTSEVINKLAEWQVKHIQVILDGDEYTHDSKRILANGESSFQTIMDNLKHLPSQKRITLGIRVNLDKINENIYSQIASSIESELPGVRVYPRFSTGKCNACSGQMFASYMDKADFYIQQYKEYENLSLSYFPVFSLGHCMATSYNTWIVGPEGELYNCQAEIGLSDKVVGNIIDDTVTNMDYVSEFMVGVSPFENEQCRRCVVLPLCGGGCALERIAQKNEGILSACNIFFKDKSKLGELLKIHYDIKRKRQEITAL